MLIHLRIHAQYISILPKIIGNYLYIQSVLEYGSETKIPHYHITLDGDIKTIRNRLTNNKIIGNESYSCTKSRKFPNVISYTIKMGMEFNNLYTPAELKEIPIWDFNTKIKPDKDKTFTQKILENYILPDDPHIDIESNMVNYIMDNYGALDKGFDEYIIYRIYNALKLRVLPHRAKSQMRTKIRILDEKNNVV